ncbi:hypothetical protein JTB14_038110 [Gonioctena quinquepunctata]|nr:hypothetical protein JTB14_038110 [Gonioctena quinquepunctata]
MRNWKKQWITNGIEKSINHKIKQLSLTKLNPNNTELKEEYNGYKKKSLKLIQIRKTEYYRKITIDNKNNQVGIWKAINTLQSKSTNRTSISRIENHKNKLITSPLDVANEFNYNFISMGEMLAKKITPDVNYEPPRMSVAHSLYLSHTNNEEIKEVIGNLENRRGNNTKAETVKQTVHFNAINTGEVPQIKTNP